MNVKQFKKEANELFSDSYLNSIPHGDPEIVANKQLSRKFKCLLKSLFLDCEIETGKGSYCYCYGYVTKDNHRVYISISDLRFWHDWDKKVLIRTASIDNSSRDGCNNTTSLDHLKESVYRLLKQEHKPIF